MKIIKIVGIISMVLAACFVSFGLTLPEKVHLERSIIINAPIDKIFQEVSSFKNFNRWSPWYDLDPNAQYIYPGPESGIGARYEWKSEDPNVGSGAQEIIGIDSPNKVDIRLEFEGQSDSLAYYALSPVSDGTRITWAFDGDFSGNFLFRYFGLILEDVLGPQYEKGLAKLKSHIESK